MRLEDITVTLRPRQPWESVDLGCAMVRRDFGRIIVLWLCTVLPLWVLVCVLLRSVPEWIPLVVWWLKPLYDRVPLFFLSRAAFGVRPTFLETWKQWPRLWITNFLPALLWRRLSFIRSFALPAQMLEGLRGAAVSKRIQTLATDGGSSGVSMTLAFSNIELVAWIGLMWGTYGLLPESAQLDWDGLFQAFDFQTSIPKAFLWWGAVCHMIIVTLIEPFYVGAGFALYLNCRTRIEGWDVELAFRRLATRLTSMTAALIVALVMVFGAESSVQAVERTDSATDARRAIQDLGRQFEKQKEPSADAADPTDPATAVREVLEEPEFEIHKLQSKQWVSDDAKEKDKKTRKDRSKSGGLDIFANLLVTLFWALVLGLVTWLVVYLVKNSHLFVSRSVSKAPVRAPKVLMGMNITRESLPDDIVAAARAAWAAGDFKEALSLLYRGSLSWLVIRRRVPITDSDTEEDCLVQVLQAGEKTEADYFRQLTGAWVQVAYAVMPVSNDEMEALCDRWPFVEQGGAA
ncbi:MAG: DUF4129 domain-containing protein [Prosthecobacter sp.]|uniref:DUF4129 domain-containing protein n=1 Tax=Prosthecobacter sp. TaxID=1965333 RepID=UPI002605E581|nr:DUF4129 domain-containing protein [Prosthecobacter sp.]MCF7789779.1 DUF4129 domain-containing protein [Prosthecobacter sp.]